MEVFEFKDLKPVPDVILPYNFEKLSGMPIIIDNGSYQCRVGWASSENPNFIFKNLIVKPRRDRLKKEELAQTPIVQVGNDITNMEAVRFQLKTQFDHDVVTHFEAQEHIFDYIFCHLGINHVGSVPHPVLLTETYLNPNYSRQLMSELLFECYNIPSIAYGVDALFGYFFNHCGDKAPPDCLLVSMGYHSIAVIPILKRKVVFANSRRINTGGSQGVAFLHRLLQLKYPVHANAITLGRAEELFHTHCRVALDYHEELNRWMDGHYYQANIIKAQLPYSSSLQVSTFTVEQQRERKKELGKRLIEINARKREERLAEDEERLNQLLAIQECLEEGNEDEYEKELIANDLKNAEELYKTITALKTRIERTKQKIVASNSGEDINVEEKGKLKYALEPPVVSDLQSWIVGIKRKKQDLLDKRAARKQRRQDMAKRRTAAAQERMRLISQLAQKEKANDDFGLRDEDWDVYKTISREGGDSDSEMEAEKLLELDEVLRQYEPAAEEAGAAAPGEAHQLHIGVERFRAPELLFQPSMTGSSEAGLVETMGYVLSLFPPDDQLALAANVVLLGGCATLPGMKERVVKDLMKIRPFKSSISVKVAAQPGIAGWLGARRWANTPDFHRRLVTREEYEERGGEYFKNHIASNVFCPTPKHAAPTELDF